MTSLLDDALAVLRSLPENMQEIAAQATSSTTRRATRTSTRARDHQGMEKDFAGWNRHKQTINESAERPFYHAREVWWCAVGVNVGNELDGTGNEHERPVPVLRPFNAETFFGVALIGHPRAGRYDLPLGKIGDRDAVPISRRCACSTRSA